MLRLQSQAPDARINIFLVDFVFDAGQSLDVVMAELTKIRKTLWEHYRGTIVVCSLSFPPYFGIHETEKAFIPSPNAWQVYQKLNTQLKSFGSVSFSGTTFNGGRYGLTKSQRSVAWGDYAEFDPVRGSSHKNCLHFTYEKC